MCTWMTQWSGMHLVPVFVKKPPLGPNASSYCDRHALPQAARQRLQPARCASRACYFATNEAQLRARAFPWAHASLPETCANQLKIWNADDSTSSKKMCIARTICFPGARLQVRIANQRNDCAKARGRRVDYFRRLSSLKMIRTNEICAALRVGGVSQLLMRMPS